MIYLASPYSDPDPEIRGKRFYEACRYAAEIMRKGLVVFSPIAHTHQIAMAGNLPYEWDYWREVDTAFLERCNLVVVFTLDGWDTSTGVQAEIEIAEELGIPVEYHTPYESND